MNLFLSHASVKPANRPCNLVRRIYASTFEQAGSLPRKDWLYERPDSGLQFFEGYVTGV
jgi:hypothetical protein